MTENFDMSSVKPSHAQPSAEVSSKRFASLRKTAKALTALFARPAAAEPYAGRHRAAAPSQTPDAQAQIPSVAAYTARGSAELNSHAIGTFDYAIESVLQGSARRTQNTQ